MPAPTAPRSKLTIYKLLMVTKMKRGVIPFSIVIGPLFTRSTSFGATMPSATSTQQALCIESDGQRLGPEPSPRFSRLLQTGSGDISTEYIPLPIPSKDPVSKLLQLQQLKRGEAPTRTLPMPAGCLLCDSHMKEARLPACTSDCLALVCARCSLSLAEKGSRARCQTCAARVSP